MNFIFLFKNKTAFWVAFLLALLLTCKKNEPYILPEIGTEEAIEVRTEKNYLYKIEIQENIIVGEYFHFMDSLIMAYDSLVPYVLTEHLLVRANPWIIDSLAETDYYRQIEKGRFIYDQKKMTILQEGDTLFIPTLTIASEIMRRQLQTIIDINIPEFKLRIYEKDKLLYEFPIRVGQKRKRYLKTAGREEDLRTKTGVGFIDRIERDPSFINPVDGKRFTHTRRDDHKTTLMPQIPWIEPQIDGHCYGQMIHPTTNPETLGKAYSNGCIGTKEADAWYIYYYAPLYTKVVIRYDLEIVNEEGDTILLKDIYRLKGKGMPK